MTDRKIDFFDKRGKRICCFFLIPLLLLGVPYISFFLVENVLIEIDCSVSSNKADWFFKVLTVISSIILAIWAYLKYSHTKKLEYTADERSEWRKDLRNSLKKLNLQKAHGVSQSILEDARANVLSNLNPMENCNKLDRKVRKAFKNKCTSIENIDKQIRHLETLLKYDWDRAKLENNLCFKSLKQDPYLDNLVETTIQDHKNCCCCIEYKDDACKYTVPKILKVYPATFEKKRGEFYIKFTDISSVEAQADTVEDGLEIASKHLGAELAKFINLDKPLPNPTSINDVIVSGDSFVTLVSVNILDYVKYSKLVSKNVYIPHWLSFKSEKADLDLSKITTDALMEKLNI